MVLYFGHMLEPICLNMAKQFPHNVTTLGHFFTQKNRKIRKSLCNCCTDYYFLVSLMQKITKKKNQNHWVSYVEAAPILEYAYRGSCVRLVQVHRLGFASPWKKVVYFVNSDLGFRFWMTPNFCKANGAIGWDGFGLVWFGLNWIEWVLLEFGILMFVSDDDTIGE